MLLIKALTPLFLITALLAPFLIGYRRAKLDSSVNYGWLLIVWAALSVDLLVPMIGFRFYGYPALAETAPENPLTLKLVMFGWPVPITLHFVGVLLRKLLKSSPPSSNNVPDIDHLNPP